MITHLAKLGIGRETTGGTYGRLYAYGYPGRLVEEAGGCIYQLCVDLGLRRYSEQQRGGALVGCAVAGAWVAFQRDAAAFPAYESGVLQSLRAKLASLPGTAIRS